MFVLILFIFEALLPLANFKIDWFVYVCEMLKKNLVANSGKEIQAKFGMESLYRCSLNVNKLVVVASGWKEIQANLGTENKKSRYR